jgi:hypothetical protein
VTEIEAGISSRAAARCRSIAASSSCCNSSREYGMVIRSFAMSAIGGGDPTTPAIVSCA